MLSRLYRAGRIKGYIVGEAMGNSPFIQIDYLDQAGQLKNQCRYGNSIEEAFAMAIISLPAVKADVEVSEFLMKGY